MYGQVAQTEFSFFAKNTLLKVEQESGVAI